MNTNDQLPQLVSCRRAARRLGVPGSELVALLQERGCAITRIGNRMLLREEDLHELLTANIHPTPSQARTRAEVIKLEAARRVLGDEKAEELLSRRGARKPGGTAHAP